jgi:hypothetical protein
MDFSTAVDRMRDDFNEMPGLELTLPQAVRLWNLGVDDCRFAVDALVDAGFLKWTTRRTIVRTGRELRRGHDVESRYVHVYSPVRRNKFVDS